ncbi:MAG: AI-2E family transporter [Halioglobus sp.]
MQEDQPPVSKSILQPIDTYVLLATITFFAYVSIKLVSPFLSPLLWATILAVVIYPLHQRLAAALGGREKLSALLIGLFSLVLLLAPVAWLGQSTLDSIVRLEHAVEQGTLTIPAPSETTRDWPLVGPKVFELQTEAHENVKAFLAHYGEQLRSIARSVIGTSTQLMLSIGEFALSIIFACVFLLYAGPLNSAVSQIVARINVSNGERFLSISVATTRNVSKAVVGIALIQTVLGGLGFFMVGLPYAALWTVGLFATALITLPILVILPAIIYVWSISTTVTALLFTLFMLPVMLLDNIFRPVIAAKGLQTPMIVIFVGVMGGAISLGMIGLFIGPVVLAVFYEMIALWTADSTQESEAD